MTLSMPIPKRLVLIFLFVSFIGFVDAGYLALKYYLGSPVNCAILAGCEIVTSSNFAVLYGVPIALIGAVYYLLVLVLTLLYLDTGNIAPLSAAALISAAGFLISLGLLYIQIFMLRAICLYCLISLASSALLFINGLLLLKYGIVNYRRFSNFSNKIK